VTAIAKDVVLDKDHIARLTSKQFDMSNAPTTDNTPTHSKW